MAVRKVPTLPSAAHAGVRDRTRQVIVVLAQIACWYGTAVGLGILGTSVDEVDGGRFNDQSSLITPGGPAFSIWSVIYIGLAAYTAWHTLPRSATNLRARATGWLAAASMALNATWLLVVQAELFWLSVPVIVALGAVLVALLRQLPGSPPHGWTDRLVIDVTFGLYLGWVSVAICANIAATLADSVLPRTGGFSTLLALAVLAGVGYLGHRYIAWFGARLSIFAAMAWGAAWISVARWVGEPRSWSVGMAAAVLALWLWGYALHVWWSRPAPRAPGHSISN